MGDRTKTKSQLIEDLRQLRTQIAELEAARAEPRSVNGRLQQSEQRFRTLFEMIPHGIAEIDTAGNITASNPAHAQIFDYSPEEMVGMHISQCLPVESRDRVMRDLEAVLARRARPSVYQLQLLTRDKRILDCEAAWDYKCDDQGKPIGFVCVLTDVTERTEATAAMEANAAKYRGLVNNLSEAVLEYDCEARILFASSQVFEITGRKPEEVVGRCGLDFVHPDDLEDMRESLQEALQLGHTYRNEYRIRHKDGHYVSVGGAGRVVGEGADVRIIGTVQDVTERKKAEQLLKESHRDLEQRVTQRTAELEAVNNALREEIVETKNAKAALADSQGKLARLLENLPDFVVMVDPQARLLYANRSAPDVPVEDLVGSVGFSHIKPEYLPACQKAMQTVLQTRNVETVQMVSVYDEIMECRLVPFETDGEISAVIIICTDVTQRKQSEEKVVREQELLRKLFDLHERERKLLSHEIHDGFVQDVVGAKMLLESAAARLAAQATAPPEEIDDARSLLAKALTEARRMITELRPMIIDERGVVESINYLLAEEDGKHHLQTEFHHDVDFDRLDPILEGTVFRIVQEALNNVRRHSKSKSVEIRLDQTDNLLHLQVHDEGVGFEPAAVPADRFGLRGIRERARLFGGQATIQSEPGKGTLVKVDLPLSARTSPPLPKPNP